MKEFALLCKEGTLREWAAGRMMRWKLLYLSCLLTAAQARTESSRVDRFQRDLLGRSQPALYLEWILHSRVRAFPIASI